jgi:hypothetical protein
MNGPHSVAAATTFLWLGMVLAISFLEAPLKFRAPGVTVRIGLGIGRLVFRALNAIECVLVVVLGAAMLIDAPDTAAIVPLAAAGLILAVQLLIVRPRLARRSDAVLAGDENASARGRTSPTRASRWSRRLPCCSAGSCCSPLPDQPG